MKMILSQSAVTAAVQGPESGPGVRLTGSGAQGVAVTPEGARFLARVRTHGCGRGRDPQPAGRGNPRHRTPAPWTDLHRVAGCFMARHCAAFRRSYPGSTLEMSEQPRAVIGNALVTGGQDLAVILTSNLASHDDLDAETPFRSHRRLQLPPDLPLLALPPVSLQDVPRQPDVMLTADDANRAAGRCRDHCGLTPQLAFATFPVMAARCVVAAGMGVTILSDMVHRPWSLDGQRIEQCVTVEPVPSMDVGLTRARNRPLSGLAQVFRAFLSLTLVAGG